MINLLNTIEKAKKELEPKTMTDSRCTDIFNLSNETLNLVRNIKFKNESQKEYIQHNLHKICAKACAVYLQLGEEATND